MNRYNRKHPGDNLSRGIWWLVFAAGIGLLVYKITQFKKDVDTIQQVEKLPLPEELAPDPIMIPPDSSGEKITDSNREINNFPKSKK